MLLSANGSDVSCYSLVVAKMSHKCKYLTLKGKVGIIKKCAKTTLTFQDVACKFDVGKTQISEI